ncbi:MAG: DUF4097 family beta strand repeat-containing protein [Gemmatimonadota bacterium]
MIVLRILPLASVLAALSLHPETMTAQRYQESDRMTCRDGDYHGGNGERYCDIREQRVRPGGTIKVDASPNGGVTVIGWDRNEILVRTKITANARSEARAREIAEEVTVRIDGTSISAEGPSSRNREWWSASFEIHAPRTSDLTVRSNNGGIEVGDVSGEMDLATTNGGLSLRGVSGDVRAETTNGGLDVELDGSEWRGRGLDARTVNGGIDLSVPRGYSAQLETGTVNGGLEVDFPIEVRGKINRRINAKLGDGGAPIRVTTTNGGVTIRRR